ncbi:MAG: hypothetical protein ABIT71_11130, partial [Vicinamibacteraceae bacterium]
MRGRAAFAVVAIWAMVTIVAIAAVAPAWGWWSGALDHTIDAGRLLGSLNVATLAELFRDSPFGRRTIATAALAGAAIALLLNPFLAGGLLGALASAPGAEADGRAARFAAHGVRFYGRLLLVALIVWPVAAVVIGAAAVGIAIPLGATATPVLAPAASLTVVAMGALIATMLVDLARIHVVREHLGAGRAVAAACRVAARNPLTLPLLGVGVGAAFAFAAATLVAVRGWLSGETWPSILLGVAAQQAYAFARTWLRATLVAGEFVVVAADAEARALAEAADAAVLAEAAARAEAAALADAAALAEDAALADTAARADAALAEDAALADRAGASVGTDEERPEMLVVVQG